MANGAGLLDGVRVISFETALSLSAGTRLLADLGADVAVVRRQGGEFSQYVMALDGACLNKTFVSINLRNPRGVELARQAIGAADVVSANLRPGVMASFGLDHATLRAEKPDLIYLQLSGYGSPGPWEHFPAYGPSVEAASGFNWLLHDEHGTPGRIGSAVFADQIAGRFAALGILGALHRRQLTGEGAFVDVSMYESLVALLGGQLAASALDPEGPDVERTPSPRGVFPCSGEDSWIAISIRSDAEWARLTARAGLESLAGRFGTLDERRAHAEEVDAALSAWTSGRDGRQQAADLQEAGVAAAVVERPAEIPFQPQLRHRGLFQRVTHAAPFLGFRDHLQLRSPWVIDGRTPVLGESAGIGMDNSDVLGRWLGLSPEKVYELTECGALGPPTPWEIQEHVRANSQSSSLPVAVGAKDDQFAVRLGLSAATQ